MPYRALAERGWTVDLHGRHGEAPASFRKYEQADLVRAYLAFDHSLGFGIGYHTDPASAALLVATPGAAARGDAGAFLAATRMGGEGDRHIRSARAGFRSDAERA